MSECDMCRRKIRQLWWEVLSEQRLSEAKQGCLGIWERHAG